MAVQGKGPGPGEGQDGHHQGGHHGGKVTFVMLTQHVTVTLQVWRQDSGQWRRS